MNATPRIDLLHGNGWPVYLWVILAHGFVFGAIGPAVGVLLSPGIVFFPIAVLFAYYFSFVAAVVTGVLVGALAPFARSTALYLLGMFIGAGCAMAFPFAFVAKASFATEVPILFAISGGFAGLVCTRLTRWIRMRWLPE